MSDRTTINVDKETHRAAKNKKQELGHSWPEVLQWYAEYADGGDDVEPPEPTTDEDVGVDVDEREIAKMVSADLEATLPNKIAEELR